MVYGEGSLQLSNFGENKFASGFNCTGFCVLINREMSKCGARQRQMVSGFHEQAAEAAVFGLMAIKAAVRDERAVSQFNISRISKKETLIRPIAF